MRSSSHCKSSPSVRSPLREFSLVSSSRMSTRPPSPSIAPSSPRSFVSLMDIDLCAPGEQACVESEEDDGDGVYRPSSRSGFWCVSRSISPFPEPCSQVDTGHASQFQAPAWMHRTQLHPESFTPRQTGVLSSQQSAQ